MKKTGYICVDCQSLNYPFMMVLVITNEQCFRHIYNAIILILESQFNIMTYDQNMKRSCKS